MSAAEKSDANLQPPFPLGIAALGIIATGLGLTTSALGIRWGAAPPAADALGFAWVYVNAALAWTWLLLWPAASLRQNAATRKKLVWDFIVLAAAAIPALIVSAFLSGASANMVWMMVALQASLGILVMGAMSQQSRINPAAIAGILAILAVVLPVVGYIWADYFPLASQAWRGFIPIIAVARAAERNFAGGIWWIAAVYAVIGAWLFLWSPRTLPLPESPPQI